MAKSKKQTSKPREKNDFDYLYEYVRDVVMQYDSNQKLDTQMVLRLKGLQNGRFMRNNKVSNLSNYSFKVILLTYKYCIVDIKNGFSRNQFKDEMHKFNYAATIVEKKLNDVYIKYKQSEAARIASELSTDIYSDKKYVNHHKIQEKKEINPRLKDLF